MKRVEKYYSNEIVFRGHPDKVCDQISAAILFEAMKQDPNTRAGIETAGGTTVNADSRAYYEEALLTKGMTYFIASRYDSSDICSASEVSKVNINVDDAETLTTVSGITSTLANSIITYRESNGIFATLEELMEVYGIGNATYRKIRNYVILHA